MININKEEILEYLEQSIILSLYRRDPVTQFNYDLNNSIIDYFNKESTVSFNPDHFEVIKPKPFFIENANLDNLNELYRITISKVCDKFHLNLVEDIKIGYLVKENDYLIVSHQYEPIFSDINNNIQAKIDFLAKTTHHSKSLVSSFENAAGGLVLFMNIENAPYIQTSLKALFNLEKYFSKPTENISFALSSDVSFESIKHRIQPSLLQCIMPIHINDMILDHQVNNEKKLKFG